jgi:hypothetical protein
VNPPQTPTHALRELLRFHVTRLRDEADQLEQTLAELDQEPLIASATTVRMPLRVVKREPSALTAAAPVVPPREWFDMPEPDAPTPLTITDEGQVYGHLAYWGECHTGHQGRCVEPPANPSGEYPWFNLGEVKTSDGMVTVGQLTLKADHADLPLDLRHARDHYAHTALAAADVHASDGEWGIWLAGALRPDASEEAVRVLRASKLSGDWRPTPDGLELIAALATNAPGFPVPRALLAAGSDGEPEIVALVAAGTIPPQLRRAEPTDEAQDRRLRVLGARAKGVEALAELARG